MDEIKDQKKPLRWGRAVYPGAEGIPAPNAIRSGPWTISKNYVDGCTLFALYRDGQERAIKYDEDVEELKEMAASLDGQLPRP